MGDAEANGHGGEENDGEIAQKLRVFEGFQGALYEKQVVEVEVYAKERHENGYHRLKINAVVSADGGVFDAEAAGAGGAESGAETVKQGHAAAQQEDELNNGERHVNQIKDA